MGKFKWDAAEWHFLKDELAENWKDEKIRTLPILPRVLPKSLRKCHSGRGSFPFPRATQKAWNIQASDGGNKISGTIVVTPISMRHFVKKFTNLFA
jgi:hypothetical protein